MIFLIDTNAAVYRRAITAISTRKSNDSAIARSRYVMLALKHSAIARFIMPRIHTIGMDHTDLFQRILRTALKPSRDPTPSADVLLRIESLNQNYEIGCATALSGYSVRTITATNTLRK